MKNDPTEFDLLERRVAAASGFRHHSQTALKLNVMRAVRHQQRRQQARRQFTSTASVLTACLLLCGLSLHWPLQSLATPAPPQLLSGLETRLNVEGEDVGAWDHVEAVLNHQTRIARTLGAM